MNLLDLLILLPLAYFIYRGFMNGIIKEVLSIVGIALAIFLTFHYMDDVADIIETFLKDNNSLIPMVSAVLIFIGTIATVGFIAFMSTRFMQTIRLNIINRLAGLVFGFLKGGILISAILLLLAGFNMPAKETRDDSITYSYVIHMAPWAYNSVAAIYPGASDFRETINKSLNKYNPLNHFPFID